jgi:hypothetical protein
MTASSNKKRLNAVEVALTPKDWSIWLADQIRSHPSETDFIRAFSKGAFDEVPFVRPYLALKEQAEQRYPGKKPEDNRAMVKMNRALRQEYHALKSLILSVNGEIKTKTEVAGLKAASKLATLETVVLQDAFGRTAKKAAEWVEEYKTADKDEEENRQLMLKELAAYMDVDFGEKWADSMPLMPGVRIRFPSILERWVADVVALAITVFAHRAAVKIIQDQHFDGHPILYKDVEAGMEETVKTLEGSIETFNAYLKTRAEIFKAEWDADEEENEGIATAIPGEREGRLNIDIEAIRAGAKKVQAESIAANWIKAAKDKARVAILDEYDENAARSFLWDIAKEEARNI